MVYVNCLCLCLFTYLRVGGDAQPPHSCVFESQKYIYIYILQEREKNVMLGGCVARGK